MRDGKLKQKKNKAVIGGSARPFNLLRNWLHQGFFYLDKTERIFRIFMEIMPTLLLAYVLSVLLPDYNKFGIWISSLLVVHSVNWIFNDNWWACLLFAFPKMKNPGEEKTCLYLNNMASRLERNNSISSAMIFGSVSRGHWHDRSDLDVRLLRCPGIVNALCSVCVLLRERCIAVYLRQPLDVYLADGINFLMKLRKDEYPIFLKKDDDHLGAVYPDGAVQKIRNLLK